MNALSGLTGYMTLGLSAKAKPAVVQVAPSKVLLTKDGTPTTFLYFARLTREQDRAFSSIPIRNSQVQSWSGLHLQKRLVNKIFCFKKNCN